MNIRNKQDFWSGVMFIAIGGVFSYHASGYHMGTAAQMGPGYFPFWIGLILAVMGAVVLTTSLTKSATTGALGKFNWRVLLFIVLAILLFAALLRLAGLYASILLLVVISSYASHEFNWRITIANGLFLALFSYLVFIRGLGLLLPVWPHVQGLN